MSRAGRAPKLALEALSQRRGVVVSHQLFPHPELWWEVLLGLLNECWA